MLGRWSANTGGKLNFAQRKMERNVRFLGSMLRVLLVGCVLKIGFAFRNLFPLSCLQCNKPTGYSNIYGNIG